MKIVDLSKEHENLYFVCLEDWSDEIKEGKDHKSNWYKKMKNKGLKVKLALDDNDVVGGMIQYLPIEYTFAEGKDLYLVQCVWVHSYKKGRGDFRKQGMGKSLVKAAEEDVKALGAKGLVVWGLALPVWMKASWFKKQGFKKVDRDGIQVLLWKPFTEDAEPPELIREKKKPEAMKEKVAVTVFFNGWCTAQNMILERTRRACREFGEKVVLQEIDTSDRNTFLEWGISDGLFIDGKRIRTGPPPSYDKIRNKIAKRVRRHS